MLRGLDGYLLIPFSDRPTLRFSSSGVECRARGSFALFGGHSEGETPLPIPNRAVKPLSADGTWCSHAWESRSPPVFVFIRAALGAALFRFAQAAKRRRAALWSAGRETTEPQLPRRPRCAGSASQAEVEVGRRVRHGASAGSGSRPYSPSVARPIARSPPLNSRAMRRLSRW